MQRLRAPESRPPWLLRTAIFFVLAYIAIWILALTVVASLRGEIDGRLSDEAYLLTVLLHSLVVVGTVVQWVRQRYGPGWQQHLRLSEVRSGQFVITLLIGLGIAWALDLGGGLVGVKAWYDIPPQFNGLKAGVNVAWVLGAAGVVLVQPIAETLIFSGLLYPSAVQRSGENIMGIVGTAVIYMLVSIFLAVSQGSTWFMVVLPLLMMLVVVAVRAHSQSTIAAMVARMGFGLFTLLVAIIGPGVA
jgi:hypothetical protein